VFEEMNTIMIDCDTIFDGLLGGLYEKNNNYF